MSGPEQGEPQWGQQNWGQQPQQNWGQQPQQYPGQQYPGQQYPGQQYPGQQYPGQPGPPFPPPPGRRTGLFVGFGAVVVAGVVVLALFLTGVIGGGSSGSSDPKQVAQNFLAAAKRGDVAAQKSYVCSAKKASYKGATGSVLADATITSVDTSDSSHATADIRLTVAGQTLTVPLELVKEDGAWKVCGTGAGMGGESGSSAPSTAPAPSTPEPTPTAAAPTQAVPGANTAALYPRIQQLYAGLTQAGLESARTKSPLPYGTYVIKFNYPGLHYTAQECGITGAAVQDPAAFVPVLSTLTPDPTYTRIASGRYAGTPVAGTVYSLTLGIKAAKSGTSSARVHVTLLNNVLYFFFLCE